MEALNQLLVSEKVVIHYNVVSNDPQKVTEATGPVTASQAVLGDVQDILLQHSSHHNSLLPRIIVQISILNHHLLK